MRCLGARIDDDESAEDVRMWMVYDPTAGTYDLICDGQEYCAWGYRTVGTTSTKFYCSWTDDGITQAWLVGTDYDDMLYFHYEENLEYTLTEDGCSDQLVGKQFAGDGGDTLHGAWTNSVDYQDELHGEAGADLIYLHDGNDAGSGLVDAAYGDGGGDVIWGGAGDDFISAGDGDDQVNGLLGADTIYGGTGADYLSGGPGADTLYGDGHDDHVCGQDGNDVVFGGLGDDYCHGGGGTGDVANCGGGTDDHGDAETVHPSCEDDSSFSEPSVCLGDPDDHVPYGHADDY